MREVFDWSGKTFLGLEERVEVCGEDFCDSCGDCLVCYGDDSCPDGGHRNIRYLERGETWEPASDMGVEE